MRRRLSPRGARQTGIVTVHLAAAGTATAITALAVLSIFGGAALTVIAGFIGAYIQARREHKRWVLDHRYEAFVRAFALIKAFDLNRSKQMKLAEREGATIDDPDLQALLAQADELYTTVADAMIPIAVLGPDSVSRHVLDMQAAYEAEDKIALGEAERAFVISARKALKIRN